MADTDEHESTKRPIEVLVVDDSQVARQFLTTLLRSDPSIHVIGEAADGESAVRFVAARKPDVVLMDIHMPGVDGFEATRRIMETNPVPIVICSAVTSASDVSATFRTLEVGAIACVEKPRGPGHPEFAESSSALVQTVKMVAEVKVVRRWPRMRASTPVPAQPLPTLSEELHPGAVRVVGIGASTGGPPVLQTILRGLPKDFSVPIVVVQHIAKGFLPGLVDWLNETTNVHVQIGSHLAPLVAGEVYLAPDDFHMGVTAAGRLALTREVPDNGLRPSVAHLFHSLAESHGAAAVGIMLSGMGKDGAAELGEMHRRGSITIAQDKASSVVHGMPGEAIARGAVTRVLAPEAIAPALITLIRNRKGGGE